MMASFGASKRFRGFCGLVVFLGLALADGAHPQSYPARPIRVVVPFGPGGSSDVVARIVVDGAAEALGQPLVIENVPGARGATSAPRASPRPRPTATRSSSAPSEPAPSTPASTRAPATTFKRTSCRCFS